jgi:hypothetical protein
MDPDRSIANSISIVERGSRIGHTKVLLKAFLEVRTLVFSVDRNPLLLQVCFDLRFVHSIVLGVFASGSVPKLLDSGRVDVDLKWNSVDPLPRRATVALAATMVSVRASHQARSRLTGNRPQLFSPSIVRGRSDHRHR